MTRFKRHLRAVFVLLCFSPVVHAQNFTLGFDFDQRLGPSRKFERLEIPGAQCGDGTPYSVFVSRGSSTQLAFNMMYGGACWDGFTCFATPLTWIHPFPIVLEQNLGGLLSSSPSQSPIADFSAVYFPYCTGDVHTGTHLARYGKQEMHHQGRVNFILALQTLLDRRIVEPENIREFLIFGSSAGALGSLYHLKRLDQIFKSTPKKTLIADAPGLHFGNQFWNKFTPELIDDFRGALQDGGYTLRRGNGNISKIIPTLCRNFPDWNIGVLQGARDVVMSRIFGELSPEKHRELVYGKQGLYQVAREGGNQCSVWVPDTLMHTFLVASESAQIRTSDGTSALDFVSRLLSGQGGLSYR
jgi:hypothetical protein